MKILLDVDGVIADYVGSLLEFIHDITGFFYDRDEITTWDIFESLKVNDATLKVIKQSWFDACGTGDICYNIKPFEGAIDFVSNLRKDGHSVVALTSQMQVSNWAMQREQWLKDYFAFDGDDIIFTSGKHHVQGNIFIDDSDKNVVKYYDHNGWSSELNVILFSAPYNLNAKIPRSIKRMNSYAKIRKFINQIDV